MHCFDGRLNHRESLTKTTCATHSFHDGVIWGFHTMFRVLLFLSAFSVWGAAAQAATYTFTSNPYSFFTYSGDGPDVNGSYQLRGPYSVTQNLTFSIELDGPLGPNETLSFSVEEPKNATVFDGINKFILNGSTTHTGAILTGSNGQIVSWNVSGLAEAGAGGFDTFRFFIDAAGLAITEVDYVYEYQPLFERGQPGVPCLGGCPVHPPRHFMTSSVTGRVTWAAPCPMSSEPPDKGPGRGIGVLSPLPWTCRCATPQPTLFATHSMPMMTTSSARNAASSASPAWWMPRVSWRSACTRCSIGAGGGRHRHA
jgi:hypothetical protein